MRQRKFFKTWMFESLVTAAILFTAVFCKAFKWTEVLCAAAVWLSFMHAQVADRMQEKQSAMAKPDVHCYKYLSRYFLAKESLWIVFFISIRSYAALAGSVIFFIYPFWRKMYNRFWRKKAPISVL